MLIGNTVTEKTIKAKYSDSKQEEYPLLLAKEAYAQVSQGEFQKNVIKTVNSLEAKYEWGRSTKICIWNATGQTLKKHDEKSWHGKFYEGYDPTIGNGQGSAILHVQTKMAIAGSSGCLVYRMENLNGDVFIGWHTPYIGTNNFRVEIRKKDHWWEAGTGEYMKKLVENGWTSGIPDNDRKYTIDNKYEFSIEGTIDQESSPSIRITLSMNEHK